MDHALETLYNPSSSEVPHRLLCLSVARELFGLLKESKEDPKNADIRQRLQVVAFGSLFSFSGRGGLGLSHSMGTFPSSTGCFWTWDVDGRSCFGSNLSHSTWNYKLSYIGSCVKI